MPVTVDPDVAALTRQTVGFLEQTAGVRSSSRLLAVLLFGLTTLVVLGLDGYVAASIFVLHAQPDGGVITAFSVVIGTLGGWGGVTMWKRNDTGGAP